MANNKEREDALTQQLSELIVNEVFQAETAIMKAVGKEEPKETIREPFGAGHRKKSDVRPTGR